MTVPSRLEQIEARLNTGTANARSDTRWLGGRVRDLEREREDLRMALGAIADTGYGHFESKGAYAAFIRDLARAALALPEQKGTQHPPNYPDGADPTTPTTAELLGEEWFS